MKVHGKWAATLMLTLVLSFASAGVTSSIGPSQSGVLPAHGSCGQDRAAVEPLAPNYRDLIRITASGIWCDGCVPEYRSIVRSDNVIELHGHSIGTDPGIACITVLTPWSFTGEIGPLPVGKYVVLVIVDGHLLSWTHFWVDGSRSFLPLLTR